MKIINLNLTLFLFLLVSTTMFGQSKTEKTLVKSFNLKGNNTVTLDLDGDIEVQEWKGEIMRIQVTIGIENGSNAMLKSLVTAGRYNLQSKEENDGMTIFSPGMKRDVKVRGEKLKESISYIVYAPDNVSVRYGGEVSSDAKPLKSNENF